MVADQFPRTFSVIDPSQIPNFPGISSSLSAYWHFFSICNNVNGNIDSFTEDKAVPQHQHYFPSWVKPWNSSQRVEGKKTARRQMFCLLNWGQICWGNNRNWGKHFNQAICLISMHMCFKEKFFFYSLAFFFSTERHFSLSNADERYLCQLSWRWAIKNSIKWGDG